MYKYAFITIILCSLTTAMFAQFTNQVVPANTKTPLLSVEQLVLPAVDNELLFEEEMARRTKGRPNQFATAFEVNITPFSHGNWETLPEQKAVWRFRILSESAYSLNLGFSNFHMPKGGHLILYNPKTKDIMGPFTPMDNEDHAELWTPILHGDELVIEVVLPSNQKNNLNLHLTSVNHDFMNLAGAQVGSCNLDVICGAENGSPLNDKYRDIMQSVALYGFNGTGICSGFLVNNSENNCRPYFMTAAHCNVSASNAPSMVVYWNFENSFCRQTGSTENTLDGDGRRGTFNSGAKLLSKYLPSDMTLVELDDDIPEAANAFFAGWDSRRAIAEDTLITIHHPGALEKRISFSFEDTYFAFWSPDQSPEASSEGDHLIVPRWSIGTTEDGSSGSPLFNKNKRVVGQLDGGAASCSFLSYDAFGAFNNSFTGGNTISTSLVNYLDPLNARVTFMDGRWNNTCSFAINPEVIEQSVCAPAQASFSFLVSENFLEPVTIMAEELPDGFVATFDKNPVSGGERVNLNIVVDEQVEDGSYAIVVVAQGETSSAQTTIFVNVANALPKTTSLIAPANFSTDLINQVTFEWEDIKDRRSTYEFQISQDSNFNSIEFELTGLSDNTIEYNTQSNTPYYWRVRISNSCGEGAWSMVSQFSTANVACNNFVYEGDAIPISTREAVRIESVISVSTSGSIVSVQLDQLDIRHSYIGDLSAKLIAPSGQEIILFERPGVPSTIFGCAGNDLLASFQDDAVLSNNQLENICGDAPAISGNFRPVTPFSTLIASEASGDWTLVIEDFSAQDGGQLNAWELSVCTTLPTGIIVNTSKNFNEICGDDLSQFVLDIGSDFDSSGVTLQAIGLPEDAVVQFDQNPAMPGTMVTLEVTGISQAGTYPFQVTAQDSSFSYTLPLTIKYVESLSDPNVIYPGENQLVMRSSTLFSWESLPQANNYDFLLFRDSTQLDTLIQSNTANNITELEMALDPGIYYWKINANNACGTATSRLIQFTVSTSSNNVEISNVAVKVYPNPSHDYLTIDFGAEQYESVRWKLISINGQIVSEGFVSYANIWTISTTDLSEGLYILELSHDDFVLVERIVKQ